MPTNPTTAGDAAAVVGYTTYPPALALVWHWDPACTSRQSVYREGKVVLRPLVPVQAADLTALQQERARAHCIACRYCALPAILDDMAARAVGPGFHALVCASYHDGSICTTCWALTGYATDRHLLVSTRASGHVALLAAGTLQLALRSVDHETSAAISVRTTPWSDPPQVSAPMWGMAAQLLGGHTTLRRALETASALFSVPARR